MTRKKSVAITLPASLTIANVEALHEQLQAPEYEKKVQFDASNVEVVDTAGLQLLLAVQRRLSANGGIIDWKAGSDALGQAIKAAGLQDVIVT
ncbi:STAS domain-containing protein [Hahella ganghwensis]|uniref:STAS domain-containing protein n=1 Tax=Hahella ganghwensis TaxID=286420 RepID=UPI000381CCA1|nr:STAS domain-containing protein [Hahella ganghwensis]